jgi:hypothetical protein
MESGSKEPSEKSREALRAAIEGDRSFGYKGAWWKNAAKARNILDEELGFFGHSTISYDVDEATRDTLIAHARQDAAHALLNTGTLLKQMRALRYTLWLVVVLLGVIIWRMP